MEIYSYFIAKGSLQNNPVKVECRYYIVSKRIEVYLNNELSTRLDNQLVKLSLLRQYDALKNKDNTAIAYDPISFDAYKISIQQLNFDEPPQIEKFDATAVINGIN